MKKMNNFEFLASIARGINPVTGEKFDAGDLLLREDVSLRLFNLIEELKEQDTVITEQLQKSFIFTPDICNSIEKTDSTHITELSKRIAQFVKSNTGYEVWSTTSIQMTITNYLLREGILEKVSNPNKDKKCTYKYFATDSGTKVGFINELIPELNDIERNNVVCKKAAQEYILSKLPELLNKN